ncbi:MAG: ATP-NAD kinase family protein [Acidilobaceae archaeon]|nr:ATP-NAD kinase family protein [Acidilobaceae archaeon]
MRLGLIVNPIAGIGGRLGLKGSDGAAGLKALVEGAPLVSPERARAFLRALPGEVRLLVPAGKMGAEWAEGAEVERCVPEVWPTTAVDTIRCARRMAEKVDLLVFVGGDGTARDLVKAIGTSRPVLGVPAGVKCYSAVFAESPRAAASMAWRFLREGGSTAEREVLDVDEDEYREGRLRVRLYGYLRVPALEGLVEGKAFSEEENLDAVAEQAAEALEKGVLYILGPGRTVEAVARKIGVEKTPLGVDAVLDGKLVGRDLNERALLELVARHPKVKIVVSPLGGQGFLFGRGNQQISPEVLRRVGLENVIVVASSAKLRALKSLKLDTGDERLDEEWRGRYVRVITGYGKEKVMKIE